MGVIILEENGKTLEESFKKIFKEFNFSFKGKVFIKPNFSGRLPIIPGENTDPEFLKVLINFLLNNGVEKIIIGHDILLGSLEKKIDFEKMIKEGGFSFLLNMPQVRLLNLDQNPREIVKTDKFTFSIPKILKEVDFYINLAKLKTHMETNVSLSIKNQMGLVSVIDRVNMHRTELDESLAHLAKLIKPNFSIIDGIIAMEGNGPHNGKSKRLNLLLSGDNMVELDSVTSFLVGFNFKKILHIAIAEKLGVGNYPKDDILASIKKYKNIKFKKAEKFEKFLKNIYVWPTKSCSRCITVLNEYGRFIKKHPIKNIKFIKKALIGDKKINIVIGRAEQLEIPKNEKIIAIGFCTEEFAKKYKLNNLHKCPPSFKDLSDYINKEINL